MYNNKGNSAETLSLGHPTNLDTPRMSQNIQTFHWRMYASISNNKHLITPQIAFDHFNKIGRKTPDLYVAYYRAFYSIPERFKENAYRKYLKQKCMIDKDFSDPEDLYHLYAKFGPTFYPLNSEYYKIVFDIDDDFNEEVYKSCYSELIFTDVYDLLYYFHTRGKTEKPLNETYYKKLYNIPEDFDYECYLKTYPELKDQCTMDKDVYRFYNNSGKIVCPLNYEYYRNKLNIPTEFDEKVYKRYYKGCSLPSEYDLLEYYNTTGCIEKPLTDDYYRLKYNIPEKFDCESYIKTYPELAEICRTKLESYKFYRENGEETYPLDYSYNRIHLKIPPEFDEKIYRQTYSELIFSNEYDLLYYYSTRGKIDKPLNDKYFKMMYNVPEDFDYESYVAVYSDLRGKYKNNNEIYKYYCDQGKLTHPINYQYYRKLLNIPDEFDENVYKQYYDEIKVNNSKDLLYYFSSVGHKEKPLNEGYFKLKYSLPDDFDADCYIKTYPELEEKLKDKIDVYKFFNENGKGEYPLGYNYHRNRLQIPEEFDEETYKKFYKNDVFPSDYALLVYYSTIGHKDKPLTDQYMQLKYSITNEMNYECYVKAIPNSKCKTKTDFYKNWSNGTVFSNDEEKEKYYRELYQISSDFNSKLYYDTYTSDFLEYNIKIVLDHYKNKKYETHSKHNMKYLINLYNLPTDFNYEYYIKMNDVIFYGQDEDTVCKFYNKQLLLKDIYNKWISSKNKTLQSNRFIENYEYIKSLHDRLNEDELRYYFLLKEFSQMYYTNDYMPFINRQRILETYEKVIVPVKRMEERSRIVKKIFFDEGSYNTNIKIMTRLKEISPNQNNSIPLIEIKKEDYTSEVDETEIYYEEIVEMKEEIQVKKETINSVEKVGYSYERNERDCMLGIPQLYDDVVTNKYLEYFSYRNCEIYSSYLLQQVIANNNFSNNEIVMFAFDAKPHTLVFIKNNIFILGKHFSVTIICKQSDNNFYLGFRNEIGQINILPLLENQATYNDVNEMMYTKQFWNNFQKENIFFHIGVPFITSSFKNVNKNGIYFFCGHPTQDLSLRTYKKSCILELLDDNETINIPDTILSYMKEYSLTKSPISFQYSTKFQNSEILELEKVQNINEYSQNNKTFCLTDKGCFTSNTYEFTMNNMLNKKYA